MKIKKILGAALIISVVTLMNSSFASQKVTIFHQTNGSQGYIILSVSPGSLQGHANHGDLYFSSLCPVEGPEFGCR